MSDNADATESIGVDPEFARQLDDNDSLFDDSASHLTSTASVGSTILEYRRLHGRTYHNFEGAEYWGPNDEKQNDSLDIQHHVAYLANDHKLFLAPVENPQKVLDVGTGTGIWAIDFGDEFPSAEVTGTDLSPIQPSWVPPNVKFELDNCELPWTFDDNSFDFIHVRLLLGCIEDWPRLYRECYRCLKPGGWLEQQEYDMAMMPNEGQLPADSIWHLWFKIFTDAGEKTGRTFLVTDHWVEWLKQAGFDGVKEKSMRLPAGVWPLDKKQKEIGALNKMALEQGLDGFASYLCAKVLGWSQDEITIMLAKVRAAMNDRKAHNYIVMKTVYVQKPLH